MKTLILASMVVFAATSAVIAPTQAASVTIQSGEDNGGVYLSDDNGNSNWRRNHRRHQDNTDYQYNGDQYSGDQYSGDNGQYRRHHRHHCRIELVSHWRHHHKVIEQVRVCG